MKIKIEGSDSGDTVTRTIPEGHPLHDGRNGPIVEEYERRGCYVYQDNRQVCDRLDRVGYTLTVDRTDPADLLRTIRAESKAELRAYHRGD